MLTLNDGRSELWQWDTGRTLSVDADCSQVHFSNKVFGRSIDVDVADGVAIIPDVLLQTDKDLSVWAFVGTADNGYTKISKTFKVNRRNKPADYVFTPVEQTTIAEIAAIAQSVRDDADAGVFNGEAGATPNIQIGTVETLPAGRSATASMTGTAENPLLNLGIPQGVPGSGGASAWSEITDKPFNTIDGNTLINRSGALCVNTTDDAEQDNTRPITSSGVHVICGNINALLQAI